MKKKILIILSLLICVGMCSCASKQGRVNILYQENNETYDNTGGLALPIDINNTSINILVSSNFNDLSNKIVIQELSERTGLDINIISVHPSNLSQKTRVLLSSNELPDILNSSLSLNELNNLGIKGTFVAINQYINELPNFKRIFVENREYNSVFDSLTAKDGNLYVFPRYDFEREVENGILFRKDIFDKHQISVWNGPEEFYQALKKLKFIYPESQPYASRLKTDILSSWATSWGIMFPGMSYDHESQRWSYSGIEQNFKDMLDYIRKMYREGLIADDFLTCSQTSWEGKMAENQRVFTTFDNVSKLDYFSQLVQKKNPDYDLRYGPPIGPTGQVKSMSKIGDGPFILNNEKKLLSLKLLDYLLSPSGIELTSLGMKNKTYMYNSEGKVQYLGFNYNKAVSIEDLEEKYGLFISGINRSIDKRSVYFEYTNRVQEAIDLVKNENRYAKENPVMHFSEKEKEEIETILTNLNYNAYSLATDYILTMNTGSEAFQNWVKKAQELGVNRILEIYNNR